MCWKRLHSTLQLLITLTSRQSSNGPKLETSIADSFAAVVCLLVLLALVEHPWGLCLQVAFSGSKMWKSCFEHCCLGVLRISWIQLQQFVDVKGFCRLQFGREWVGRCFGFRKLERSSVCDACQGLRAGCSGLEIPDVFKHNFGDMVSSKRCA